MFREQTETDYYGEAGPSTATATEFEERMKERLGGTTQLSNMTRPPPRNITKHAREIEGTVFQPSATPSGAPTGGKSYKEVAEISAPENVLIYTAADLQAERDQHIEVAAEQAKSAAVKIAEEKMSQIAEQ